MSGFGGGYLRLILAGLSAYRPFQLNAQVITNGRFRGSGQWR